MPEKLERCVRHVMAKGYPKSSAWPICVKSTGQHPHGGGGGGGKKKKKSYSKKSNKKVRKVKHRNTHRGHKSYSGRGRKGKR